MAFKEMRYLHPGWNAERDEIMVPPLERDPTLDVPVERNRREMEEAETRAAREWNANTMSDQEIRARALECACRLPPPLNAMPASIALETMFWETVRDFEAYIKGEKT